MTGALKSSIGNSRYSNFSCFVLNAVFSTSYGLTLIWWNPKKKTTTEIMFIIYIRAAQEALENEENCNSGWIRPVKSAAAELTKLKQWKTLENWLTTGTLYTQIKLEKSLRTNLFIQRVSQVRMICTKQLAVHYWTNSVNDTVKLWYWVLNVYVPTSCWHYTKTQMDTELGSCYGTMTNTCPAPHLVRRHVLWWLIVWVSLHHISSCNG